MGLSTTLGHHAQSVGYISLLEICSHMSNEICDVVGCEESSERSLSKQKVSCTGMELKNPDCRNVHLCKKHYKEWKKLSKGSIPDYFGAD